MCGITGIMNIDDKVLLHNMCQQLVHRGPDSDGFYEDSGIGLGIRRLSIIDVKGGNQPIQNENGDIWTIFNGEIYNYKSLQEDLISKGHKFKTDSDTETIVHSYEEYGLDFVNHLRGMFAIAIWDERLKRTILVRDRLGVKPLYYYIRNNQLLFASELKVLLEYKQIKPTINRNAISNYLTYLYIPAPDTIFNEIKKLMPAEILVFNHDGTHVTKKYWDIEFQENNLSIDECAKNLRELLEESVKLRLVSDVPVGILLSSGLDSATVTALATKQSTQKLNTYTVGFEDSADKSYNELSEAKELSDFFGTNHKEIIVNSEDAFKLLDTVSWQLDEPFGNPTTTLNYIISEFASRTSKVVITGVGGDEMFGGYPKYRAMKIFEEYSKFPRSLVKLASPFFLKIPDKVSEKVVKGKIFFKSWKNTPIEQYLSLISYFTEEEKKNLLQFETSPSRRIIDDLSRDSEAHGARNFFQNMYYIECKSYLPDNILEYTDKTSMAVSLEVREPLIDHKIAEFCANIPFDFKIRNGSTKHILKLAMKNELPKNVLNRRKRGFTPPLINWLNNSISDLESQYISKQRMIERGLNYDHVKKLIDDYKTGNKSNYAKIWSIICLEAWFNKFIQKYGAIV
ncbi:MAG: asparagine synthase (glutamine-hydrolyzing) [Nitrosopumilaceae archaeon]|nr:MAG: asparagine synthase (glutamine-hydrolyzing) [Nitrosopumilaceae archaeon]